MDEQDDKSIIVETEDIPLSDDEGESSYQNFESVPLNIDYNSRIVSSENSSEYYRGDSCDVRFHNSARRCLEEAESGHTSSEEVPVSDEETPMKKTLTLECLKLDSVASVASKIQAESCSNLNYFTNFLDDQQLVEMEYMSDDEDASTEFLVCAKKTDRNLPLGLSLGDGNTVKKKPVASFANKYLPSQHQSKNISKIICADKKLIELTDEQASPLMTCLEFLKSENSDEGETDVENISTESIEENLYSEDGKQNVVESHLINSGMPNISFLSPPSDGRKNSLADALTEDETLCLESDSSNLVRRKMKKRRRRLDYEKDDYSSGSLTDEEIVNISKQEWTESAENGAVRQITQIKTETSIKLEGDGAVRSLRKVPKKESSPEDGKNSTDSEQEDLSFTEKKSFFQRLSLTSDTLPTSDKWIQDVSLDDLPMAEGEIIQEQISFEDKLKMFEPDEGSRKKIQKREKVEQPTVYRYDFTKNGKDKQPAAEFIVSELEKAEEIVKQVNEELNIEESCLNDPYLDLSNGGHSDLDSAFTLDRVEQEVSSLLAEVDKEEKELSNDLRRVSCSRTDSEKSSNVNSRIFDMDSEKGSGSFDLATMSPDAVQDVVPINAQSNYEETNASFQFCEKVTAHESPFQFCEKVTAHENPTDKKKNMFEHMEEENATKLHAEAFQDHPVVESSVPLPEFDKEVMQSKAYFEKVELQPLKDDDDDDDDDRTRKLNIELCKKEEFKEALKLEEDYTGETSKFSADRNFQHLDISLTVDSHIKSEILREEIDQSIEESPLEVKHIAEDLEHISAIEDHKPDVYKQIRTEIFTQVLGEEIESGSPEKKELSSLSPKGDINVEDEIQKQGNEANQKLYAETEKSNILTSEDESIKKLSPQISEESAGQTDDISSEGAVVEPDEHLVDYEEAKDEHSLTEQLQALASDSMHSVKGLLSSDSHQTIDFSSNNFEHASSGMSSSMSDIELHCRGKDVYSRHDKKEIRSLKSTKQVSTIEEHSSIESCDSPQELLQELPEKTDIKAYNFNEKDLCIQSIEKRDFSDTNELSSQKVSAENTLKTDNELISSCDSTVVSSPKELDFPVKEEKLTVGFESEYDAAFRQSTNAFDKSAKLSRSDSKSSSQGKKSDSDAEGSKIDGVAESSKRKEESYSSSGETESPYYSVETSDSGKTPRSTPAASRPCSSEFEINVFSGHGSEYETCVTSQDASGEGSGSYATAVSSQEISYATACSSFSHSSRESAYSVDSESSGHLASVEVSSEASETLVPSAQEMELEFAPDLEMPVLDEEPHSDDSVKEPYDMEIPESIIRGGIEIPFMKSWDVKDSSDDDKMKQLPQQWTWQYASEQKLSDDFEVLEDKTEPNQKFQTSACTVEGPEESSKQSATKNATKSFSHTDNSSPGPSHRRSMSSVIDFIPSKNNVDQTCTIDEEQLSVSESSATHSEQTWQTSSVDTAMQLSATALGSCTIESQNIRAVSDSPQESPLENELMSEQSNSILQVDSSFLQLNGPVEVDYNPDYDNLDGTDSELRTNRNQSFSTYENEGLQFELEIDGSSNALPDEGVLQESPEIQPDSVLNGNSDRNFNSIESNRPFNLEQGPPEYESHNIHASIDADKPEAQQEQSFSVEDYNNQTASESLVCPDLTSYLPESEQCDLLSGVDSLPPSYESEINIPFSESVSSREELPTIEQKLHSLPDLQNADPLERTDIVDTSPEDERYEYKSLKLGSTGRYSKEEKSIDFQNSISPLKSEENDVLAESDYVPPNYQSKYDEVPNTDLYTHHEEEEFDLRDSDVYPSPIPSVDEDKQSTPSSSVHGRKFFPRSCDTSAASSLQEFERLEAEIAAGRLSRSSIDSTEKMPGTKSGDHDDVSMCSLTEFEKLEKECVENETAQVNVEDIMLSEIEEGLESQCSDAIEILPESLHDYSDSSEYERRRLDIEEVIKVAQSNVEKFHEETTSEGITSDECTVVMKVGSDFQDISEGAKTSSKDDGNTDVEESEPILFTSDPNATGGGHDSSSSEEKNCGKLDCMVSSTDSIDPSSSTATHATYQFETDSVMSSSINSAQASGEECTMVSSTDTLEPEPKLTYSMGDSTSEGKGNFSTYGDGSSTLAKGALACKLEELQSANGAQEQMEMFLSKLTDESVLMDDFTSHSFPDESESHKASDDYQKSFEAAHGFSTSDDGTFAEGDDLISRTTATTTTRIVTTVTTDQDGETHSEQQVLEDGDDLRHSVEVILNQFMSDDSKPGESVIDHDE